MIERVIVKYWLVQWFELANTATAFWFAPVMAYYDDDDR
jgi:hypothetical protein